MTALTIHVKQAKSFKEKTFGPIFYKRPQNMVFKTRFGIHTFGMRYPIDVLILNEKNNVVKIKRHLVPNRLFLWSIKYDTVVELKTGTIQESHIKLGNHITLSVE